MILILKQTSDVERIVIRTVVHPIPPAPVLAAGNEGTFIISGSSSM